MKKKRLQCLCLPCFFLQMPPPPGTGSAILSSSSSTVAIVPRPLQSILPAFPGRFPGVPRPPPLNSSPPALERRPVPQESLSPTTHWRNRLAYACETATTADRSRRPPGGGGVRAVPFRSFHLQLLVDRNSSCLVQSPSIPVSVHLAHAMDGNMYLGHSYFSWERIYVAGFASVTMAVLCAVQI